MILIDEFYRWVLNDEFFIVNDNSKSKEVRDRINK